MFMPLNEWEFSGFWLLNACAEFSQEQVKRPAVLAIGLSCYVHKSNCKPLYLKSLLIAPT